MTGALARSFFLVVADGKFMIAMSRTTKAYFIAGCILVAAVGDASLQIWLDYRETYQRQETTVRDISRIVEAQVSNTVHQAETMLGLLADMIQADNGLAHIREPSRWKKLHTFCEGLPGCKVMAAVDASGQVLALSNTPDIPNFAVDDRAYFQAARDTKKLFVGAAIKARVLNNPIIYTIARPVFDSSGKMLAVVAVGMETAHLIEFYGLMGFGVNPVVSILKRNGDVVARHPDMALFVERNFSSSPLITRELPKKPSGVYSSYSVVDKKLRIAAYKYLPEPDLVVYAGIDLDNALDTWRTRAWRTGLTNTIAILMIFLILYWGSRVMGRELHLKARNIELDRLSNLDSLTGIANRRYFDNVLKGEWARHKEEAKPLSLLMIDIDCFKQYNDRYGHQLGDECLHKVAQTLQESVFRNVDVVARYGGEEFAVILDIDHNDAIAIGERMRLAIEQLAIPHEASTVAPIVTISGGVASLCPGDFHRPGDLVSTADAALYAAKQNGRNRIVSYPSLQADSLWYSVSPCFGYRHLTLLPGLIYPRTMITQLSFAILVFAALLLLPLLRVART